MLETAGTQFLFLGPVYSTPEKMENGALTRKTHQMLSADTAPEEFEILFAFEFNSGRENT